MPGIDIDRLLALLRDPAVESQEIAAQAGVPREEAGRASRLLAGLARAKPEDAVTLPGPLAAAVARAALAAGRGDLLAALAAHGEKDVAKEAKRGLHLLRARGVDAPEPPRPAPVATASAPEAPFPAHASGVDGQGERVVWLSRAIPGKGIEMGQAVLSDERGLVDLHVALVGRKEWRSLVRDLAERGASMGVAEIDGETARSLVAEARRLNDASGARVPDGADRWLAQMGPAAPRPDPASRFPALPDAEEREALAASAALHELPLLRGWLPDEAFLREVAARLDEISVSPLYVDERQKREQMQRTVSQAVERLLEDGGRRARLASRLFSVAEHLDRSGGAASARAAAAAARAVAAGTPAHAIPFARALVEKAFRLEGPEAPPEAPAESPLIVAPR